MKALPMLNMSKNAHYVERMKAISFPVPPVHRHFTWNATTRRYDTFPGIERLKISLNGRMAKNEIAIVVILMKI